MRDISAQLQRGVQAFLQQSMDNMFTHLAPGQTNPASKAITTQPHIVSITPLPVVLAAKKSEEPMNATQSQPPPAIKKGLANIKASSAIASLEAVASQVQVPPSSPIQASTSHYSTFLFFSGARTRGLRHRYLGIFFHHSQGGRTYQHR